MGQPKPQAPGRVKASICAIGDELTLGQNVDTNSAWIADRLASMGVITVRHVTVADDQDVIAQTLGELAAATPLVICTGGLGPTPDDCTRPALAQALCEALVEDAQGIEWLEAFSRRLSRPLPESNRVQVQRPASARLIANPNGTAPGLRARLGSAEVYCLPGPPREMKPMFDAAVAPAIGVSGPRVLTRFINSFGVGESAIAERLGALLARDASPTVGLTTDGIDVRFRIRAEGAVEEASRAVDQVAGEIMESMGVYAFGEGEVTLSEVVVGMLAECGESLVTVESCTGGLLGSMITAVPGSSSVYSGGWVTYSNEMKEAAIRVPRAMIETHGAVSEPVARAMAEGGLLAAPGGGVDHALALTGIAGPGGGSDEKPVGTVFIARASRTSDGSVRTQVRRFRFSGDRVLVRQRAAQAALAMLRFHVHDDSERQLLWQCADG